MTLTNLTVGTKVVVNGRAAGAITRFAVGGFYFEDSDGVEHFAEHATDSVRTTGRGITNDELALMRHITMFGSTGYPVRKLGRKWTWDYRTIKGPRLFATKRDAVAHFEAFMGILRDAYAGRL